VLTPSSSASGRSWTRWRSVGWASALTSSGVTKLRPESQAHAREVPSSAVAPRGETQWVRNLRASGEGRLRKGRRMEQFTAAELPDQEKPPILRAYLKQWAWEVGAFFHGVGADAPDEDLRRIAPLHPIFRISHHR